MSGMVVSDGSRALPRPLAGLGARAEDALLVLWVAVAGPLLDRLHGGAGAFDPGHPVDGAVRLGAVLAALVGLAARPTAPLPGDAAVSVLRRGVVGPLTGGLLLIAGSGLAALGSAPEVAAPLLGLAATTSLVAAHWLLPPLSTGLRRALVLPLVLVAGGLFRQLVGPVVDAIGPVGLSALSGAPGALAVAGFVAACSAVYYAMLVYAPRQMVEPEGGPLTWLIRYGLFAASVLFGLGWLRLLGL